MKLPKHVNLVIEHQPQTANYETVEEWMRLGADHAEILPEDAEEMILTGEAWLLQW